MTAEFVVNLLIFLVLIATNVLQQRRSRNLGRKLSEAEAQHDMDVRLIDSIYDDLKHSIECNSKLRAERAAAK